MGTNLDPTVPPTSGGCALIPLMKSKNLLWLYGATATRNFVMATMVNFLWRSSVRWPWLVTLFVLFPLLRVSSSSIGPISLPCSIGTNNTWMLPLPWQRCLVTGMLSLVHFFPTCYISLYVEWVGSHMVCWTSIALLTGDSNVSVTNAHSSTFRKECKKWHRIVWMCCTGYRESVVEASSYQSEAVSKKL